MSLDKRRWAARILLLLIAYYPLLNWAIRKVPLSLVGAWEDIMVVAFFLFALVTSWRKLGRFLISPVGLTGLLFLAASFAGFAFNSYYVGAFVHEARLTFEPFLVFMSLWLLIDSRPGDLLRSVVPHLVFVATIIAAIGVYQYVRKVPVPAKWLDSTERTSISTRAYSLFGSPNVLAAYLETILPLGIYLFLARSKWYERIVIAGCVVITGSGFLLTLTRASWLSAAGSFFVGLLVLKPVLALVFAVVGAAILFVVPTFRLRMTTLLSSAYVDKSNNLGRLFRWKEAFLNLKEHPLFGSGLGSFGGSAAQQYGFFTGISMDSVWIRVLTETGILGFFTFVAWLASGFAEVFGHFLKTKDRLWLFVSIGLLALLANLFTDNLLDSWAIALLMWSLFALGAVPEADE
jgi:O-antigen ligase